MRAVFEGQLPQFRSVPTKESYQIGPSRTPERQKSLTLTFTKQALRQSTSKQEASGTPNEGSLRLLST